MLCIYYVRQLPTASAVFKSIIISASLQAIIVILQKYGYIESRHYLFAVTGTFGNPGPVAGYIAIGIAITISTCRSELNKRKLKRAVGYGVLLVLQFIALCYADSRASFIAALVGVFFIENKRIKDLWNRQHRILIPILLLLIIGSCVGVFQYRPDSANARILVWRVSCDMIVDKPIWGHGVGAFDKKYMLYQADYFAKYPESHFTSVADNASVPYNELLRITVEWGIVGILLVLFLFLRLFQHHSNSEQNVTAKGGVVSLSAFSMFSYPANVLPLLLLCPILTGLIDSRLYFSVYLSRWSIKACQFISVICCVICLKPMFFYAMISKQTKEIILGNTNFFFKREIAEQLLPNSTFSNFYVHGISRKNERINDSLIHYLPPTCETYCYIGDIYTKRKSYDKAEYYYKKASYMIPTRFTPNYKTWKLYLLKGDTIRAIQKAGYIQKQKLKVENSVTIKAKAEIKKFLIANPPSK